MTYAQRSLEAASLMLKGEYQAALDLYKRLAEEFPNMLGECQAQMASMNFVLKNYDQALKLWEEALAHGIENTKQVQDAVQRTREALAKQAGGGRG